VVCERGCLLYAVVGLGSWSLGDWEGGRFLTKRLCATGLGGREVFDQTSMRHSIPVPLH
jgi:hypothetical protein